MVGWFSLVIHHRRIGKWWVGCCYYWFGWLYLIGYSYLILGVW